MPIQLWRKNRRDFIAWLVCLITCLCTQVEIGLLCGVILNLLHLLFMWARPETVVKIDELDDMQYIRIVPNVGMFFPGIDHLRETVNKAASAAEYKVPVVVDCIKFNGLDYTSAQVSIIIQSIFPYVVLAYELLWTLLYSSFTKLHNELFLLYFFRVLLVLPTIYIRKSKL